MTSPPVETDDVAEQYRLAENYQSGFTGPNVSERLPTADLAVEYAGSDSSYASKTQAFAATHTEFRRISPDGNSLLFGYFEILLHLDSPGFIDREKSRFEKLKESLMLIPSVAQSGDPDGLGLLDSFFQLFDDVKEWLHLQDGDAKLLHIFNDVSTAGHVLYPIRMFVSAHLRANVDDFQAFIFDSTLDDYCGAEIDTPDREIDEIGTTALYNVLLQPPGIGLEVYNLHTNPGSDVDLARQHESDPALVGGSISPANPPIIRLLFRPTHYDLVYKQSQAA